MIPLKDQILRVPAFAGDGVADQAPVLALLGVVKEDVVGLQGDEGRVSVIAHGDEVAVDPMVFGVLHPAVILARRPRPYRIAV